MFSYEFWEIFNKTCFHRRHPMAAPVAMCKYCNKNIKTTSVEEILLIEGTIQYKFWKSRKFSKEVFLAQWHCSGIIAIAFFSNYSYDSETYSFMILYLKSYWIICLWSKFEYWNWGEFKTQSTSKINFKKIDIRFPLVTLFAKSFF